MDTYLRKSTPYLLKDTFSRHSYYYQLTEMYTERFQKHNKNDFLCLPDDKVTFNCDSAITIIHTHKDNVDHDHIK